MHLSRLPRRAGEPTAPPDAHRPTADRSADLGVRLRDMLFSELHVFASSARSRSWPGRRVAVTRWGTCRCWRSAAWSRGANERVARLMLDEVARARRLAPAAAARSRSRSPCCWSIRVDVGGRDAEAEPDPAATCGSTGAGATAGDRRTHVDDPAPRSRGGVAASERGKRAAGRPGRGRRLTGLGRPIAMCQPGDPTRAPGALPERATCKPTCSRPVAGLPFRRQCSSRFSTTRRGRATPSHRSRRRSRGSGIGMRLDALLFAQEKGWWRCCRGAYAAQQQIPPRSRRGARTGVRVPRTKANPTAAARLYGRGVHRRC